MLGFAISPDHILGIITTDPGLDATDSILGHPGTLYPTGLAFRGLELPYAITPDAVTLGPSYLTISFVSNTMAVMDQMCVITLANVPEPSSICLAGIGAALFGLFARRKLSRRGRGSGQSARKRSLSRLTPGKPDEAWPVVKETAISLTTPHERLRS